jgi:predicted dinucleotide-binding enzyme
LSSRVTAALHHVAAASLLDLTRDLSGEDVLVCGDDEEARALTRRLCAVATGRPGVDTGPLRMARQLEPFTAVLIAVDKRYRIRSGLALTHVPDEIPAPRVPAGA